MALDIMYKNTYAITKDNTFLSGGVGTGGNGGSCKKRTEEEHRGRKIKLLKLGSQ